MSVGFGAPGPVGDRLEVGVLGPFQAKVHGQWSLAPTRQVAKVGALLAAWPGMPVDVDRLVAAVWGGSPPATAANTLQVHISTLRKLVGKEAVRSTGVGYVLTIEPQDVDAFQFQTAVADAERLRRFHHFQRASERLIDALALWRGTPFGGVDNPDVNARRTRLVELRELAREDLLECRVEMAVDQRALARAITHARELVAEQPQRARFHVLLVRALAAAGRSTEALAAHDHAVATLRSAGVDPGHELAEVHAAVVADDPTLRPRAARFVTNVPRVQRPTQRVGRLAESVRQALVADGAKVVWVACPIGSTGWASLPGALVHALAGDYATGVVLVDADDATHDGAISVLRTVSDGAWGDLTSIPDAEALAVIIRVGEPSGALPLIDELVGLQHPPRVVVFTTRVDGLPDEVVIEAEPFE